MSKTLTLATVVFVMSALAGCSKDRVQQTATDVAIELQVDVRLPDDLEREPLEVDYRASRPPNYNAPPSEPAVRAVIEQHRPALTRCLGSQPSETIYVRLRPDGTGVRATVATSEAQTCMGRVIREMKFPQWDEMALILSVKVTAK